MSVTERTIVLRASSIAAPLAELARASCKGRVLAGFERSGYLDLNGCVVAVLWPGLSRGPFAISLAAPARPEPLSPDATVRIHAGRLDVGLLSIDLAGAAHWNPALSAARGDTRCGSPADARARRDVVVDILARLAPAESVVGIIAPTAPRLVGTHAALLAALDAGLQTVCAYVDGRTGADELAGTVRDMVAGRGPGLTPSGDDVLVGVMHALTTWPSLAGDRGAVQLRARLLEASAPRTTRISRAYLEAAAAGSATEVWHDFVRSLGAGDDAVREAVAALVRVGETSGADALTGFCWAWSRLPQGGGGT